ncbi:MAG TPA: PQQ-binding-like beta-propeller repeat protein [Gemmataceae bacterium]|nr:PQQ-binding-like beta-propeller repeat protein [Gemmataceae bacterium]
MILSLIPRRPAARRGLIAFFAAIAAAGFGFADDWPQWLGPQRDGVWRENGIVERFPAGGPPVRWRTPIKSGYASPAVVGNRVYVMDFALKPGTRSGNVMSRSSLPGVERVLCLDDSDGHIVWEHKYDCDYAIAFPAGPRATPVVAGGRVYTLGAMGDLLCLDAENGKPVWSVNLPQRYGDPQKPVRGVPLWGYAASPLLDGDRLITLGGDDGSVVVALHKDTGKELWKALSSFSIGYCPPVIYSVGKTRQLIVWHPEAVCGLDPQSGQVFWEYPFPLHRSALAIPMPRFDGKHLFVTSFYNSALMLDLGADHPAPTVLWQGKGKSEKPEQTATLHSIMPTPVIKDGFIYGIDSYGELRCLRVDTGERVWTALGVTRPLKDGKRDESKPGEKDRWDNAFLDPQGDRCFIFNEAGELIIAKLEPTGYTEIDRAKIIEPDNSMPNRKVVWSQPAYAHRSVYVRNDHEIVCVSLAPK